MSRTASILLSWVLAASLASVAGGQEKSGEPPAADPPKEAVDHALKGYQLQKDKKFPEAMAEYDLALGITRNYPGVLWNQALIHQHLKQFDQAVDCYREMLRLVPNDTEALYDLGLSLNELGHQDEALRVYEQILAIDPGNLRVPLGKGVIYHRQGKAAAAIAEFEKIIDSNPGYALYDLACVYSVHGDAEKALHFLERSMPFLDDGTFEHAKTDTDLDPIRKDPRFQAIFEGQK